MSKVIGVILIVIMGIGVIANVLNVFSAALIENNYSKALFYMVCLVICIGGFAIQWLALRGEL